MSTSTPLRTTTSTHHPATVASSSAADAQSWGVDIGVVDFRSGCRVVAIPEDMIRGAPSTDVCRFANKVVHWFGQCTKYHNFNWWRRGKGGMRQIIVTDRSLWYCNNLELRRHIPLGDVKVLIISRDCPDIALVGLPDYDIALSAPSMKHQQELSTIIRAVCERLRQEMVRNSENDLLSDSTKLPVQMVNGSIRESGVRVNFKKPKGWKYTAGGPLTSIEELGVLNHHHHQGNNKNSNHETDKERGVERVQARDKMMGEAARIIETYDPSNYYKVPEMLQLFQGREALLVEELRWKYAVA